MVCVSKYNFYNYRGAVNYFHNGRNGGGKAVVKVEKRRIVS